MYRPSAGWRGRVIVLALGQYPRICGGRRSGECEGVSERVSGRTLTGGGDVVDPVLLEIIAGSLASIEREVETAIGRTARSPMIRDAHDFRAGIHDRLLRKLTGRPYSELVQPVVRDFPTAQMRPGEVFFHNDVYLSEGGIGHLPDLCVTVPVFHDSDDGSGERGPAAGGSEGPNGPRSPDEPQRPNGRR